MVHLQLGGELGVLFVRFSVLCTMRQMGGAGVSILPWSARLGSGLEGVAQFSTLVLEEGLAKIGISKLAPAYGCSGNASSGL